jgi:hypothetical protein
MPRIGPYQVFAATLTLSQPGGQIMPTLYWGPWLAKIRRGGPVIELKTWNLLLQITNVTIKVLDVPPPLQIQIEKKLSYGQSLRDFGNYGPKYDKIIELKTCNLLLQITNVTIKVLDVPPPLQIQIEKKLPYGQSLRDFGNYGPKFEEVQSSTTILKLFSYKNACWTN